jgi:hypothetical protein
MTADNLQAIQECDIYIQSVDGVLEDASNLKRTIQKYSHEIPLAIRLVDAANVLRDLEGQENNVRAQLRMCIRQLHRAVHERRDRQREQMLAKMRTLYIELDRLHGLQEKAKTHVEGVRLERQIHVSLSDRIEEKLANFSRALLKALGEKSSAFSEGSALDLVEEAS